MKLFIVLAAIACCNAAKLDKTYLPPSHSQSSGGSNFLQVPFAGSANSLSGQNNGPSNINAFAQNRNVQNSNSFGNFENRPERAQAAFERNAGIFRLDNQNDGETYAYAYETENGINAEENGVATNGVEAQGGYSYTGDDGQVYSVRYTAGQNGFVPQGDHLPTPPPIPEEILKALEQNARDEAAGIYDDGSYNAGKYNEDQSNVNAFNQFNNGNAYQNNNDDDAVITDNALFRNPSANFNSGNSNQRGFNGAPSQGVNKAYLPPFADQRTTGAAFGNRRQPSFSPKSGYRY